jgi:hypothetical protein
MMAWDVTHPYKLPFFQGSRELARRFWSEESAGAEVVCAWTDLKLPLDRLRWQADRAVMYRCHQAIYSERHAEGRPPRLDRVNASHPLRLVVFNEEPEDAVLVERWMTAHGERFALRARREHVLNQVLHRGKRVFSDRYVVYEMASSECARRK